MTRHARRVRGYGFASLAGLSPPRRVVFRLSLRSKCAAVRLIGTPAQGRARAS